MYPQTELDLVIAGGQVYNVIVKDLKCVGVSQCNMIVRFGFFYLRRTVGT
jgi:hypothetical protein